MFKSYLLITRPFNLLMIAVFMYVFRYGFLNRNHIELNLSNLEYFALTISLMLITAAGYVINDIIDQNSDKINKPNKVFVSKTVNESAAYNFYFVLNILGVGLGFLITHVINKPNYIIYFILLASLLYFYSSSLKKYWFLGNLIVAFSVALGLMSIIIFDVLPQQLENMTAQHYLSVKIVMDYVYFGFLATLIRELIKDTQDSKGDAMFGVNTIPVKFGISTTKIILTILMIILLIVVSTYTYKNLFNNDLYISVFYLMSTVLVPIIWGIQYLWNNKNENTFKILSLVYKIIMFFGMISVAIIHYQIINK